MDMFTHEEKLRRNEALVKHRMEYPNESLSNVALVFSITKQRVSQILHTECQKRWYRAGGKEHQQKWREELKIDVLTHYGNGKCACVGCGESRSACLSIDHIDGGGNQQRKRGERAGYHLYLLLKRNGFPRGYQTLCMNCQFVKVVLDKSHEREMK